MKTFIKLFTAILAGGLLFGQVTSVPTATGGGASTFDNIGSGTNTSATMTCGAGCTLVTTAGVFRLPNGTSAPGTCTVGDAFFDTDATAGSNMYGCTATNTWTLLSGGGGATSVSDLTDCKVTSTTTVITIAGCRVTILGSDGRWVSTTLSSATYTITAGTESGTARLQMNPNGGSPILECLYESATMTASNYAASGCTETAGTDYTVGALPLASVTLTSGAWSTTPTESRSFAQVPVYTGGDFITLTGNDFDFDTTAFLGTAQTWTARQIFTPTATDAALRAACAALPSSPANGDVACDSGDSNKVKVYSNGAWVEAGGGSGATNVTAASTFGTDNLIVRADGTSRGAQSSACTLSDNGDIACSRSTNGGIAVTVTNSASAVNNNYAVFSASLDSSGHAGFWRRKYHDWDGIGNGSRNWNTMAYWDGNYERNIISAAQGVGDINIGGGNDTGLGWMKVTGSSVSRIHGANTAGIGLAPIMGAPTESTGQTGDVAATTLLASGHTAGMYRVCGFVAVTGTGTGSTTAWTLSWRSPASGTDLTHTLFWSSGAAETDTFSVATANEFNVCKVIRSTNASNISLNPGDVNTATYTMAWTVERLR